jgi:DNA replication protein DnaC
MTDLEQISLRKITNPEGKKYCAKDAKNSDSLLKHNEGYRFLKNLRGSPPYYEKVKKNVFAMMRYHGQPTFFTTFSAAEHQWTELLQQLGLLVDERHYTEKEIYEMSAKEKQRLILARSDVCARHFNHRTNILFNDFLKPKDSQGPLGKLKEFFYRIEFQKRGSPHLHCLLWIEGAPVYEAGVNDEEVCKFIDNYISCSKHLELSYSLNLESKEKLIGYQTHHHTRTCPHKSRKCRFNFPKPPMDETTILEPGENITKDTTAEKRKIINTNKENFKKIDQTLNEWTNVPEHWKINSLTDFLEYLKMSKTDYVEAVKTSITIPTPFLKRNVDERWINAYNPRCLATWQANMDCQYITNGYAAASYILDYVTKGERGMSELLRATSKEAAFKELKQNESLQLISRRFIDFIETGSQEAVYFLLGLQLYNSSNAVIYIPTGENNARLLKPKSEIEEMEDDDEDITVKNGVDRYAERPPVLENICLAEFMAYYNGIAGKPFIRCKKNDEEFLPEQEKEQVDDDKLPEEKQTDTINGLKKRKKPKIIRYVNYDVEVEPENHYRELLMLFHPYRDLEKLNGDCASYKERYFEVKDDVDAQRDIYTKYREQFDRLLNEDTTPNEDEEENEVMNNLAPSTIQQVGDNLILQKEAELRLPNSKPAPKTKKVQVYHHDDEWSEQQFHAEAAKLNKKQFQFVLFFLHMLKQGSTKQLHWFLSGGAGVGKTTAINVLYEAVRRYYNSLPNQDHSKMKIVKCAFTGKASHQIKGYTIHHLFKLCFATKTEDHLSAEKLARLKELLGDLEVLIIDEISMVNNEMFTVIDERLRAIKQDKDTPFGGVHVIVVGDLFQLSPVKGRKIWEMGKPKLKRKTKRRADPQKKDPVGAEFSGTPLGENVWETFQFFELKEIMRQRDEKEWAEWLNRLRENMPSDDDKKYIRECIIDKDHPIKPNANYITLTNKRAMEINKKWFSMAPKKDQYVIKCIDIPHPNQVVSEADILINIHEKAIPTKVQNLMPELELAIGHEYDFVINLDTLDGITNGTPCFFQMYQENSSKGDLVWVDPRDERVGKAWKQNYYSLYVEADQMVDKKLYPDGIPRSWLPIPRHVLRPSGLHFSRKQFPLRPSKARTVDRCQGITLGDIVVDFSDMRSTTEHCHYVAFSRCPKKSNVHILGEDGFAEKKIRHDKKCIYEMDRLRNHSQLSISMPCLFDMKNEFTSIMFMNAQSMCAKFHALVYDWNVRGCTILGVADTRFEQSRERIMLDFDAPELFACNDDHPSLGLAVYNKIPFHQPFQKVILNRENVVKASLVAMKYPDFLINGENTELLVSFLYVLPNARNYVYESVARELKSLINNKDIKFVIMGDFNRNPNQLKCFQSILKLQNKDQKIKQPTHDQNGVIDLIFSNIECATYGVLD